MQCYTSSSSQVLQALALASTFKCIKSLPKKALTFTFIPRVYKNVALSHSGRPKTEIFLEPSIHSPHHGLPYCIYKSILQSHIGSKKAKNRVWWPACIFSIRRDLHLLTSLPFLLHCLSPGNVYGACRCCW